MPADVSIITATHERHKHLVLTCEQVRRQRTSDVTIEHIVVADGPDPVVKEIAEHFGCIYAEHEVNRGAWGAYAKDTGLQLAQGRWVCFWDDDNSYEPTAVMTLLQAIGSADLGVVQTLLRQQGQFVPIPAITWTPPFILGQVDMMCVLARREVALSQKFSDTPVYPHDFEWLDRLQKAGASVAYLPVAIGRHL